MLHARRAAAFLLVLLASSATVYAQSTDSWPIDSGLFPATPTQFVRGPGFYLSWVKLLLFVLVYLGWVRTADWINRDAQEHKDNYARWNQLVVFGFFGAVLAVTFFVPWFVIGFPLVVAALVAPTALYARQRNAKLDSSEHVFTREHLQFWAANALKPMGVKVPEKAKGPPPPPITFTGKGGKTDRDDTAHQIMAKQTPGFAATAELIVQALVDRGSVLMLEVAPQASAVRYQVDGIWKDAPGRDLKTVDAIFTTLKTLAGLNPAERKARQRAMFGAEHEKTKYTCRITSQATKAGERVMVLFDNGSAAKRKLSDLGMSPKMQGDLRDLVGNKKGFILVAAPPVGGLTTLTNAAVGAIDRFMRSVAGVDEVTSQELKVENVPITTFDAATGQSAAAVLTAVSRQYPDAIVVSELTDAQTVGMLCEQVAEERLVVGGIRAKESAEALLRVLMLKVPLKQFVPVVLGVVTGRLIRKLCETCKQSYTPPPQTVQQFAANGQKIDTLYRPPQPPTDPKQKPPPVCPDCQGSGYRGRTGLYELLVVNDLVRATLAKTPQLENVRAAARKAGMRTMQEEGVALVAQGVTSLQELMRVLKE
jgi:type II secretory ATPase GspE/PulE/Tfp pilus assembly ATPase PilB-like protein